MRLLRAIIERGMQNHRQMFDPGVIPLFGPFNLKTALAADERK